MTFKQQTCKHKEMLKKLLFQLLKNIFLAPDCRSQNLEIIPVKIKQTKNMNWMANSFLETKQL